MTHLLIKFTFHLLRNVGKKGELSHPRIIDPNNNDKHGFENRFGGTMRTRIISNSFCCTRKN